MSQVESANFFVWVLRDNPETEKNGFQIPDAAQKKPNRGTIHSVGSLVMDKNIKKGKIAIFNKQVGEPILFEGVEYTILRGDDQILGIL